MNAPLQLSAAAQMRQIRALYGHHATVRAERLQIRAIEREWTEDQLAGLLCRLVNKQSLARANGWGSAGKCPASSSPAKTPAVGERCIRVAAGDPAPLEPSVILIARANQGPAPASFEDCSDAGARVRYPGVRHG